MPDFINISKADLLTLFQSIAYMAEVKEWDNRQHVERIRHYVMILARGVGLPFNDAEGLSISSMLHDIGKSMIPEELLKRKGQFNPDEWKIVEQHTTHGKRLLEGNGAFVLQSAEAIAYSHHERWDGSGYPQKLAGPEIPVSGRICAMADVYDALTTVRSYKKVVKGEEALGLIEGASGKLFDPELVKVFKSAFNDIEAIRQRLPSTRELRLP
jgi:putative two-component system response regulator